MAEHSALKARRGEKLVRCAPLGVIQMYSKTQSGQGGEWLPAGYLRGWLWIEVGVAQAFRAIGGAANN